MNKRFPVPEVRPGTVRLDAGQSRHARDVLRLTRGTTVDVFDPTGATGTGPIIAVEPGGVTVEVTAVQHPAAYPHGRLTVASAVPKGSRADWMVEKLSELGVDEFRPLVAARSVVVPDGRNKLARWLRIAEESAKQSRRSNVMRVTELADVNTALAAHAALTKWCLTTRGDAEPLSGVLPDTPGGDMLAMVGPEGGWTDAELAACRAAGCRPVTLTRTVLRVETAAVAVAAVVMCGGRRSATG